MPILKGYRIYEPLDPLNPSLANDTLVKQLEEGVHFQPTDTTIDWTETIANSTRLNAGQREYRYVVAFDDENVTTPLPADVIYIVNLVSPNDLSVDVLDFDKVQLNFTAQSGANSYSIEIKNLTTNQTTYQTLPVDNNLVSLTADTQYTIKIASVNTIGDIVGYSSSVTFRTLPYFYLNAIVTNRQVQWDWTYGTDINSNHFELRKVEGASSTLIANTGLAETYTQNSMPTQKITCFVRIVNNDSSYRDSQHTEAIIYNDFTSNYEAKEGNFMDFKERVADKITITKDDLTLLRYQAGTTRDDTLITADKRTIYNIDKHVIEDNIKLYSTNKDPYVFRLGLYKASGYSMIMESKGATYTPFTAITRYKMLTHTSFNYPLDMKYSISKLNGKDTFRFRQEVQTIGKSLFTYNSTMFASKKYLVDMSMGVANTLSTGFAPPRFAINNTFSHPLTRGRDGYFNPIKAKQINNKDVIWNEISKEIDVKSQINRVRILCVGDSITAGAPSYDPQYGGTPWVADLITGKFYTRNDPESQYPYWLQLKLGIEDYEIINCGTGRQTTENVLNSITDYLEEYKPQYCICLIGTNNVWDFQDKSQEVINAGVEKAIMDIRHIADKIIQYNAKPVFGTNLPRNSIVPRKAKDALRAINNGIKLLGNEKDFDVVDWYDAFVLKEFIEGQWVENGVLNYSLSGDDTHPNVKGYKFMAEKINLAIFTSFRAEFRLFREKSLDEDVNYSSEEPKTTPSRYISQYTLTLPIMRRLQSYTVNRYIKNTGNSWGMFMLEVDETEDIIYIWDKNQGKWVKEFFGQLAPNDIYNLKIKFVTPAIGKYKEAKLKMSYIEFRR